ncbi:MAG: hypothetical protein JWL72_599 [Ilumatobacteraceae bacterium]|nr:hypothetical protein [Ilumatobacteraceae bacterium]
MNKPRNILAALAAGTFVLAACSAGSTDYKAAAEKAITGTSGLGTGSKAECVKPTSTDVGTTFDCTGTGADGSAHVYVATIDKKNHVQVQETAGGDTGTPDTTGGSTVDTAVTDTTTAST